jgi:hypothetical protein
MSEHGRSGAGSAAWRGGLLSTAALFGLTAQASAHVSDRGFVMLLPTGHYIAGGAIAVAVSFLALALLPPDAAERQADRRIVLFTGAPARGRTVVSLLSFAALLALVLSGWWGSRDPLSNPLPLTVWTLLWVGMTLVQGVFGNIWAWLNPWYGPWRLILLLLGRRADAPFFHLPRSAGYWPALLLFLAFAWFELIDAAPDDPARLATVTAIYFAGNLLAMLVFGHEAWSRRGECLSVFFCLIARFSILERSEPDGRARLALCWPGAKLRDVPPLPSSGVLFLLLTLASVSFDGLSRTFFWLGANGVNPLEFPGRTAMTGINTAGLLLAFVTLSAVFMLAVSAGERAARSKIPFADAAGLLVWSMVPIALAYHFSHYLTVLLINGQYAVVALSDPFARGWDLFGTAHLQVFTGVTMGSQATWLIWNLQAGAIILGHMLAVLSAHLLAYRLHPSARAAALSQLPLTLLMIGYTVFGLWLLSTPTGA